MSFRGWVEGAESVFQELLRGVRDPVWCRHPRTCGEGGGGGGGGEIRGHRRLGRVMIRSVGGRRGAFRYALADGDRVGHDSSRPVEWGAQGMGEPLWGSQGLLGGDGFAAVGSRAVVGTRLRVS
ncbi:unnamed protein product [Dicrocoelium dendriticum]|nr:unnamed protein product [Dicrocoelium dendriticum]